MWIVLGNQLFAVGVGKRNFDHFLNPVVMILKNEQEVTVHSPTFFLVQEAVDGGHFFLLRGWLGGFWEGKNRNTEKWGHERNLCSAGPDWERRFFSCCYYTILRDGKSRF